jgi:hypothetical protein
MLSDSNPDGQLVDLFSAAVDYQGDGLSLSRVEDQLAGLGTLRLAYNDTPDMQFARNGGPVGSGWAGGLGGLGGGHGFGGGNAARRGADENSNGNGAGQSTLQNSDTKSGNSGGDSTNTPGGNAPNGQQGPQGRDGGPNAPTGAPSTRAGGPGTIGGLTSTAPLQVPEPSVLLLAGMGLTGLATVRRRRTR